MPAMNWTDVLDAILTEFLRREKDEGRQAESGWKKTTWERLIALFASKGIKVTVQQLRDRFGALKKKYKDVRALRNLSGFGWDEDLKQVTASAGVWEALIESRPKAKAWRAKGFPLFDDLAYLCEDIIATGDNVVTGGTRTRKSRAAAATASSSLASTSTLTSTLPSSSSTSTSVSTSSSTPSSSTSSSPPGPSTTTLPTREAAPPASRSSTPGTDSDEDAEPSGKSLKRSRSFRGHEDSRAPAKRARVSNATALLKLAESVGSLVSGIAPAPSSAPAAPSTPSRRAAPASDMSSPARRDRAFRRIVAIEQLTPRRLVRARIMFRGRTELADEYMSFGDGEEETEARQEWLNDELEEVLLRRARRQSDWAS